MESVLFVPAADAKAILKGRGIHKASQIIKAPSRGHALGPGGWDDQPNPYRPCRTPSVWQNGPLTHKAAADHVGTFHVGPNQTDR